MVPKIFSLAITVSMFDYIESSGTPNVVKGVVGSTSFNSYESLTGPLAGPWRVNRRATDKNTRAFP
jgi:hypothetical protein